MKNITSEKASSPIMFALVAGLGLGFAYGAIKSFNLSLTANILSFTIILLIMWLVFRQGKASSYANAQAWAQNEVDIAIEVANTATAKANALSEAYSMAISQANAQAINEITVNMPNNEVEVIENKKENGALDETRIAQLSRVAMGELSAQELETMWQSPDLQKFLYNALLNGARKRSDLGAHEMLEPNSVRGLLHEDCKGSGCMVEGHFLKG
jgi:hypothetical protein